MTTLRERTSTVALRLAVGVAVAVAGLVPAGARGSGAATAAAMTLARVPASVQPGGDLDLRLRVSHATPDMVLRVSVHSAITSRTAFADTIAGHDPGDVVDDVSIPVAFLPRTRAGDTRVPVGLQDPDARRDVNRLAVDRTGVYPLTISLSPPAADPVATIDTWLVVAERALNTPLSFAWVWQLVGTPLTSANRAEVQATVESDGRLGRIAQALRAADGVPLSLVLGPETFATWATIAAKDDKAAGIETVRQSVANETSRQVLATPYVPLDIPALESARLAGDVVRDLQVGTDTIESVLGVLPDPRTVLLDPIDEGALAIARNAFAQRTVVREQAVRPVAHRLTPARPFDIAAGARTYPAAASNAFVARLLAGAGPPAERAQRFLAGLSLIALEAPSSPRGIVVATPTKWNPDPKLVLLVLKGLRGHPLVRATTLDGYFALPRDTNDDGTPIVTSLLPIRPNPPTVTPSQLAAANESLASFRSLVGNDDARVKQGAHSILIAPSSALDRGDAARELATIDNAARRFLESIATTGRRTITLTSRTARVPLSFSNRTGQTVRVRVHLVSSKLRFPDGSEQVLDLPPRNTTRRFLVEARTSGTFTMRVTLTTADNQFTIATTEMTVRSTVFSSIGVLLTVGALAFLAIWWGNHIRRSRRARRAAAATTPAQ